MLAEELDADTGRLALSMDRYVTSLRNHLTENPSHRDIPLIEAGARDVTSTFSYVGGAIFFGLLQHRVGQARLLSILGAFYQQHYAAGATSKQFAEFVVAEAPAARPIIEQWFLGHAYATLLLQGLTFDELVTRYAP